MSSSHVVQHSRLQVLIQRREDRDGAQVKVAFLQQAFLVQLPVIMVDAKVTTQFYVGEIIYGICSMDMQWYANFRCVITYMNPYDVIQTYA